MAAQHLVLRERVVLRKAHMVLWRSVLAAEQEAGGCEHEAGRDRVTERTRCCYSIGRVEGVAGVCEHRPCTVLQSKKRGGVNFLRVCL